MPETGWTEADLTARLCRALEIAGRTVRLLAGAGYTSPGEESPAVRGEKIVVETGLLLLAAGPACGRSAAVRERVHHVAEELCPYSRGERVYARVCMEPPLALDHAAAHLCLSRLGFPDPDLDRLLRQSLESQAAGSRERHPHRLLEQEWLMRVWNVLPGAPPDDPSLARLSPLGRPMDVLGASRDEMYGLTHAVMYATDLGTRPARLPRPARAVAADAEAALAWCLDEPDYDVAGEVLLTWPYLRRRWSAAAAFGFGVLASVEDRAGFLPGSGISVVHLETLKGEERSRYAVASAYHTAYVMGLLAAASLAPGCAPPAAPGRAPRASRGVAAALIDLIADERPEVPWRDRLATLGPGHADAAASLVLNVCLRRAVARRDLGTVVAALRIAEQHGLLDAPACRQAAELLRRAATFGAARESAGRVAA